MRYGEMSNGKLSPREKPPTTIEETASATTKLSRSVGGPATGERSVLRESIPNRAGRNAGAVGQQM